MMITGRYKNIEFFESDPPATPKQIAATEKMLGANLPAAYHDFLLTINGGFICNRPSFMAIDHGGKPELYSLKSLNGVEKCESDSISSQLPGYEFDERVPDLIIPIGTLVAEYRICLSLRKEDYGHIYMWGPLHMSSGDNEYPNSKSMKDLFFVATSFTEFLAMLKPLED